jgi:hypothetical protein
MLANQSEKKVKEKFENYSNNGSIQKQNCTNQPTEPRDFNPLSYQIQFQDVHTLGYIWASCRIKLRATMQQAAI